MTERSLYWQDGVGDGGPYSQDALRLLLETLGLATGANVGVVPGILNELAVTSTGDNNITANTGHAVVDGTVYENDASNPLTSNDPGGAGTTGRRLVLQKNWAARTVRLVIITSADDVTTIPALTQVDGVTWEIPLASFQIAPSGAITALTDEREYTRAPVPSPAYVARAGLTRYTVPGWYWLSSLGQAQASQADRVLFILIAVRQVMTFDRIALRVDAAANGGEKVRLGVYEADESVDGLTPGALLLDGGSALAIDGASTTVEDTISLTLTPGYYFLAYVSDATGGSFLGPNTVNAVTVPITAGAASITAAPEPILRTDANAGANWANNGLPDPAPAVTDTLAALYAAVRLRDSS